MGDGQPPGDQRMGTPEIKQQGKDPSRDWLVQGAFKVCLGWAHSEGARQMGRSGKGGLQGSFLVGEIKDINRNV